LRPKPDADAGVAWKTLYIALWPFRMTFRCLVDRKDVALRTALGCIVAVVMMLALASPAWAQVRENEWILDKIKSLGFGDYFLAVLVVVLAAILMVTGLLRRSRR
jgi:hypothetical protein